jgi:hypothetical protein
VRELRFLFQEPGLLEAVAFDPALPKPPGGLNTPGYRSLWVADLLVDYDPRTSQPYSFMSSSFDKTYPLVIWALKLHMADERFNVPQAGLQAVPLHEAFTTAPPDPEWSRVALFDQSGVTIRRDDGVTG